MRQGKRRLNHGDLEATDEGGLPGSVDLVRDRAVGGSISEEGNRDKKKN